MTDKSAKPLPVRVLMQGIGTASSLQTAHDAGKVLRRVTLQRGGFDSWGFSVDLVSGDIGTTMILCWTLPSVLDGSPNALRLHGHLRHGEPPEVVLSQLVDQVLREAVLHELAEMVLVDGKHYREPHP